MKNPLNPAVLEQLRQLASDGRSLEHAYEADRWNMRALEFISTALGHDEASSFYSLNSSNPFDTLAMRLGRIEGLIATGSAAPATTSEPPQSARAGNGRKVFVVHGHDEAAKEGAARFLAKIGLEPIILHEQPNSGRTIMEKFETYSSDVAFAVVLLTPDDVGCGSDDVGDPAALRPRARQNVIMELGYFVGRLGRTNVCALHKGNVELPSDYQGVLYLEMDEAGAWKTKLAQELIESKITIDLAAVVSG